MKSFTLALQFLTVIRLPWRFEYKNEDFSHSLRWFFFPGLLIGALQWLLAWLCLRFQIRPDLSAPVIVVAGILATGGLHLDGAADTADGFGAGHDREGILRIMKDDRLGVFGITAVVMMLYLKIIAIRTVFESHELNALLVAPALSRSLLSCACTMLPYARSEGRGKAFSHGKFLTDSLPSFLFVALIILLLTGTKVWIPLLSTIFAAVLFCGYCYSKIRGYTGDTLGFQNELCEILFLIVF